MDAEGGGGSWETTNSGAKTVRIVKVKYHPNWGKILVSKNFHHKA